jgi:D-alanyl-lipoteichoic acid acyltransferase DltB (MBOAT superfamily)
MTNFRIPYSAQGLREFWQRWHISLSTWFRDYVYIPLGGNRGQLWKWMRNIFLTFVISGFWHGASWNFIIWGAIHGIGLLIERYLPKLPKGHFYSLIRSIVTFHFVVLAWVFFRAETLQDAGYILSNILHIGVGGLIGVATISQQSFLTFWIVLILLFGLDMAIRLGWVSRFLQRDPKYYKTISALSAIACCIYLFGVFEAQEFIYFQF